MEKIVTPEVREVVKQKNDPSYDKKYPNSFRENFSQKELDDFFISYRFTKIHNSFFELGTHLSGVSIKLLLVDNLAAADLYTRNGVKSLFDDMRITNIGDLAFLFEKNVTICSLTRRQEQVNPIVNAWYYKRQHF